MKEKKYLERKVRINGFQKPFSNYQILGWILLFYEVIFFYGFYILAFNNFQKV